MSLLVVITITNNILKLQFIKIKNQKVMTFNLLRPVTTTPDDPNDKNNKKNNKKNNNSQ